MKYKYTMANIGIVFLILSIFALQANAQPSGGSISGLKINDLNGNGKLDTGEVGIAGWTITLIGHVEEDFGYGHPIRHIRLQTKTDKNGFYKFDNLPAGRYRIMEAHDSKFKPTSSFIITLILASGQNSVDNNFFNQKKK